MVIVIFILMFPNLYKKRENTLSVKYLILCWYPGAGLYRKVSIIVKNESIDQWGQFVTTPFISEEVKVNIKTKLLRKIVV
jgi:beta-galactosidase